jgi:hypothetical protein
MTEQPKPQPKPEPTPKPTAPAPVVPQSDYLKKSDNGRNTRR